MPVLPLASFSVQFAKGSHGGGGVFFLHSRPFLPLQQNQEGDVALPIGTKSPLSVQVSIGWLMELFSRTSLGYFSLFNGGGGVYVHV